MTKGWSALGLAALLVLVTGLAQTGVGHSVLRSAGLFQPPVPYTALAFTHPQDLPERLGSRHVRIGVSFAIRNMTGVARSYRWSILQVRSGRGATRYAGVSTLPAGGQAVVARSVPTVCAGGRLETVVRLSAPHESISFWTSCWSRSRGGA